MTAGMHNYEQVILKIACPPLPDVGYALRTFRIDLERWCLLPVDALSRSSWSGNYGVSQCDTAGHYGPRHDCGCGIYGQHSLGELRAAHRQADTLVAVMEYDPIRAIQTGNEVRAMSAHVVAYWISPDLPGHDLAASILAAQMNGRVIEYRDLDAMLAHYRITERVDESTGRPVIDSEADPSLAVRAADGARHLPRWVTGAGLSRAALRARAARSGATVIAGPLRQSFYTAWSYATVTLSIMSETLFIAACCVALHHLIRTRPQGIGTHFAWLDPVLLAGRNLLYAVDTPPVLLTVIAGLAAVSAVDIVRWYRPLTYGAAKLVPLKNVVLSFVFKLAEYITVTFGTLFVLTWVSGRPESAELGWLLAGMFVLIVAGRSVEPLSHILGHLRSTSAAQRSENPTALVAEVH